MTRKVAGRPPKFKEPRRPVTVTLPQSTLSRLSAIHPDRARAIVKVTELAIPSGGTNLNCVEVVEVQPGVGIIIVGPSKLLKRIEWLHLVEIAPLRFLLTIPPGTPVDSIELAIADLLEDVAVQDESDRSVLVQLKELMRGLRRQGVLSKGEMLFINTEALASSPDGQQLLSVKAASASARKLNKRFHTTQASD